MALSADFRETSGAALKYLELEKMISEKEKEISDMKTEQKSLIKNNPKLVTVIGTLKNVDKTEEEKTKGIILIVRGFLY